MFVTLFKMNKETDLSPSKGELKSMNVTILMD